MTEPAKVDDLRARLRRWPPQYTTMLEAADTITALRAQLAEAGTERDKLRAKHIAATEHNKISLQFLEEETKHRRAAESALTRARKALDVIAPAVESLACHQVQCDEDGVMVQVSRQAVDEVVNSINQLAIDLAALQPNGIARD